MVNQTPEQLLVVAIGHQQKGQFQQAEALYRQALAIAPNHPDALHLLGMLAVQFKRLDSGLELIHRAMTVAPGNVHIQNSLAGVLLQLGRRKEALAMWQTMVALHPSYVDGFVNLGICLQQMGRVDEAIECYQRALKLQPNYPVVLSNLGGAYHAKGMTDQAIDACRRTLAIAPSDVNACRVLAFSFQSRGQFDEACQWYRRAIALERNDPDIQSSFGTALQSSGHFDEAAASYQRALALNPKHAEAHFNSSLLYLLRGDFARGWKEYEWRWSCRDYRAGKQDFRQPQWDGSNLAGRTILLHTEQGFGDAIQFIRYVPMLAKQGATIYLGCTRPTVMRLLARMPGITQCFTGGQPLPRFDCHCPLLSLPPIMGTTLETIPSTTPYLSADPADIATWAGKMADDAGKVKVGLVWASAVAAHLKSMPLSALAALAHIPNIRLYSLQTGEQAREAKSPPAGLDLVDWTEDLKDFADTAALIANLDLVISVDTAVAHLAGALGKPVWTLLKYVPDWSWLLGREDSLWYPTMRLFRQQAPGDWQGVVKRVTEAMTKLAGQGLP